MVVQFIFSEGAIGMRTFIRYLVSFAVSLLLGAFIGMSSIFAWFLYTGRQDVGLGWHATGNHIAFFGGTAFGFIACFYILFVMWIKQRRR